MPARGRAERVVAGCLQGFQPRGVQNRNAASLLMDQPLRLQRVKGAIEGGAAHIQLFCQFRIGYAYMNSIPLRGVLILAAQIPDQRAFGVRAGNTAQARVQILNAAG